MRSDLDVLVQFERPVGLSEFLALEYTLWGWSIVGVDLVTRSALNRISAAACSL
jgi:predicted nucleotidyltransferase